MSLLAAVGVSASRRGTFLLSDAGGHPLGAGLLLLIFHYVCDEPRAVGLSILMGLQGAGDRAPCPRPPLNGEIN